MKKKSSQLFFHDYFFLKWYFILAKEKHIKITDLEKIAEELREKENSMAEEFARIKRELNSETINPDTFLTLSKILTDAKQKLTEIGKQEELKNIIW